MPATLVIADGRRSSYGIAAVLGALEGLDEAAYPRVEWPGRGERLPAVVARVAADPATRVVVLWSFFSTAFTAATEALTRVRAATPGVVHIAGGAHASAEPELTARGGWDYIAHGEGEHTIRQVVAALREARPLTGVEGLGFLDEGGFRHRRGRPVDCLDESPSFAVRQGRVGPIEVTRGCVYACRFCQTPFLFKARFRHRSVDSIRWHVRALLGLGMTDVRFLTPTAMSYGADGSDPDLDEVQRMLVAVRAELPAAGRIFFGTFPSEIRPEHATLEALQLVKRLCNNDNVIIGGQSGSDRMLIGSHRGHDAQAVRTAVENCVRVGLRANVDFLFGMPGEDAQSTQETIDLCRELAAAGARIHTHTFMPLPGTPWSHQPPGVVAPPLQDAIRTLESRGQAYGNWEAQQALAAELAAFDSFRNRRKRHRR